MTLKQLKAFLALARTLNYANASLELHLSQSALSLTIKSLEEELGGKLFNRNTRQLSLLKKVNHSFHMQKNYSPIGMKWKTMLNNALNSIVEH